MAVLAILVNSYEIGIFVDNLFLPVANQFQIIISDLSEGLFFINLAGMQVNKRTQKNRATDRETIELTLGSDIKPAFDFGKTLTPTEENNGNLLAFSARAR